MNQCSTPKRNFWKKQIEDWSKSGQSGRKWAESQGHNYHSFLYWKSRFHSSFKREEFIELQDKSSSQIQIHYQGIRIEIDEHFNAETLGRLLTTIKNVLC